MRGPLLKILATALKSLLFLAGLAVFTVLVLAGTEWGSARVVRKALEQGAAGTGLALSAGRIEGTLLHEVSLFEFELAAPDGALRVYAQSVAMAWQPFALFSKRLEIQAFTISGLRVTLPAADPGTEPATVREQLGLLFTLPVTVNIDRLRVDGFTLDGDTPVTLQAIAGSLALDGQALALEADVVRDAATRASVTLTLAAGSFALDGSIDWETRRDAMTLAGAGRVDGDPARLAIEHRLTAPVAVASTGELAPGLPGEPPLRFDLRHRFSGVGGAAFNAPALQSLSGTLVTAGDAATVNLELSGDLVLDRLGALQATLSAVYAADTIAIASLGLAGDRFTFSGAGTATLGETPGLALDWSLAGFNDGDLFPGINLENVDSRGSVALTAAADGLAADFAIASVEGTLNGYGLAGRGNVRVAGGRVEQVAVTLDSGGNTVFLDGTVSPQLDLSWELEAPVLARVLPDLQGIIRGRGTLTGTPGAPQVNGNLVAGNIAYRRGDLSVRLAEAAGEAVYAGTDNQVALDFAGLQVQAPGLALIQETGELVFSGTPAVHDLRLQSVGPDLSLALSAAGGYADAAWRGELSAATVDSGWGNWVLQDVLPLVLAADAAEFDNHCWRMNALMLCGEADWLAADGLAGSVAIDNFPLAWLNAPEAVAAANLAREAMPSGLRELQQRWRATMPANGFVEGMLDMTLDFAGVGADPARTTLALEAVPRDLALGIIRRPPAEAATDSVEVQRYGIDEITLTAGRRDSRWRLDTGFEIYLRESGGLEFQGDFTGAFALGDDDSLDGNFDLAFNNVGWVESLVPNLRNVNGVLGAGGSIGGSLGEPLLNIDATLGDGSFELPEYGLVLEAVNLAFHSEGSNAMTIAGSARSGEGGIQVDSVMAMPLQDSRTVRIGIKGSDFRLVNLPETRVTVNPDLVLDYRDDVLDVSGSLAVPSMLLDLRSRQALFGNGSVDVSRDVVIVAAPEDQPDRSAGDDLVATIPVTADVRVTMGDDVHFLGFGLDLMLTGELDLEQTRSRPLLAHGELSIPTGSYGLYGQRLTIEDGKLLFLGNPLNPALDIRAVRQTRTAEVGVLMNGTVSNIQAQLFSTPTLPESEILSLLITGNSFQNAGQADGESGENMLGAIALLGLEKGQGLTGSVRNRLGLDTLAISSGADYRDSALGLGKYLRPNLFMRYDIGLFDREDVLTLDYLLSDRVKLQVETGVSQSVDLTYTVEK